MSVVAAGSVVMGGGQMQAGGLVVAVIMPVVMFMAVKRQRPLGAKPEERAIFRRI